MGRELVVMGILGGVCWMQGCWLPRCNPGMPDEASVVSYEPYETGDTGEVEPAVCGEPDPAPSLVLGEGSEQVTLEYSRCGDDAMWVIDLELAGLGPDPQLSWTVSIDGKDSYSGKVRPELVCEGGLWVGQLRVHLPKEADDRSVTVKISGTAEDGSTVEDEVDALAHVEKV
jgi:hypothetical protein